MSSNRAESVNWTRQHLLPTLHLYTQLPFGKLDARNPKVKQLAMWLGRSVNSVAMKLTNLSSLDPVIAARGLSGLKGASALDRAVWDELHANWDAVSQRPRVNTQGSQVKTANPWAKTWRKSF